MAATPTAYVLSVNQYNKPAVVEGSEAIALNLVRLLLLEPGSDPLHPEMGVGLRQYRYALTLDDLTDRIEDQIQTYLPEYEGVSVDILRTDDKVANIEITVGDTIYVYDSANMPVEIDLDLIQNS